MNVYTAGAIISECGIYRYLLTRTWDEKAPPLCWIMLNPSTADADFDDPTIRKCMGFAAHYGYGGIRVVNLYALRATNPKELWRADDPVGPRNDRHIYAAVSDQVVILGYGVNARPDREREVLNLIRDCGAKIHVLKLTDKGKKPQHPLYLPYTSKMIPYEQR